MLSSLISVVCVGGCAWWASRQQLPRIPTSAHSIGLLGAAVGVCAAIALSRGWRWHVILREAAIEHRRRDAYALTVIAYMGNVVLPARGGEVLRIYLLSQRTSARQTELIGTVVPERALDAATLALLFAVLSFSGARGVPSGELAAIGALAAVLVGALALIVYLRLRIAGRFQRFADRARPFLRATRLMLSRVGAGLFVLTVAIWMAESLVLLLVARALDLHLVLDGALAAVVCASLAASIPAGPGFVGTFDAAVLFSLNHTGIKGGTAFSLLLLYRAVVFLPITIVGLVLVFARYGGWAAVRRRADGPAAEVAPEAA